MSAEVRAEITRLASSAKDAHRLVGLRNDLPTLVDILVRDFGWVLEPIA